MLFPQTMKDITMTYNVISGLYMCFSEWRFFGKRHDRRDTVMFKSIMIKTSMICIALKTYQV